MKDWAPKLKEGLDYSKLDLTGEEGFVLSRIDGATTVTHLTHLTGMPQGQVRKILSRLLDQGALAADGAPAEMGGSAPTPGSSSSRTGKRSRGGPPKPAGKDADANPKSAPEPTMADEEPVEDDAFTGPATLVDESEAALAGSRGADGDGDDEGGEADFLDGPTVDTSGLLADAPPGDEGVDGLVRDDGEDAALSEEALDEELGADGPGEGDVGAGDAHRASADDEGEDDENEDDEGEDEGEEPQEEEEVTGEPQSWRRYFEENLHPLDADERVKLAREASGITLVALCFDPNPKVIQKLVENMKIGLQHARLIAEHHRVSTGLDALQKRAAFVRDRQVQRFLFRNPQLSDRFFQRIMQNKRMIDAYQLVNNRDATERARTNGRKVFRDKFVQGTAEERVNLIVKCEGRCLNLLLGLSLEGRTVSLLCQRPMHSTLLLQNLARWPSTPPPVLVHMFKQPLVKRTPVLKTLISRHPNAPNQLKRGAG